MMEVKIIDPNHSRIDGVLGITDERSNHLLKLIATEVIKAFTENITADKAIVTLSKECKHPNELAFVCYSYGKTLSSASHNPNILMGALIATNHTMEDFKRATKNL